MKELFTGLQIKNIKENNTSRKMNGNGKEKIRKKKSLIGG